MPPLGLVFVSSPRRTRPESLSGQGVRAGNLWGAAAFRAGVVGSSYAPPFWLEPKYGLWIEPGGSRTESGHAQSAEQVWGLQVGRFRTAHPHASSNYLSQTPNSLAPGCESHTPKCFPIGCCRGFVTLDSFIGRKVASAQDWLFIEIEWRGGGPAVPSPLLPAPFHPLPGPVHLKLRGEKKEFRWSAPN